MRAPTVYSDWKVKKKDDDFNVKDMIGCDDLYARKDPSMDTKEEGDDTR